MSSPLWSPRAERATPCFAFSSVSRIHLVVVEAQVHELRQLLETGDRLDVVERQVQPLQVDQVVKVAGRIFREKVGKRQTTARFSMLNVYSVDLQASRRLRVAVSLQ